MLLFDIGANIGRWAIANCTGDNKVVSVEASPNTFKKLSTNTLGRNIVCLNYAVTSSSEPSVDFFDCIANTISTLDEKWLNDTSSRFFNQYSYKKIKVNTITIDKLIADYGVPDILKVDVEGAENIVIKSLTSVAKTICFEWAAEWYDKTVDAIEHLERLGYSKYHIQNSDEYTYIPPNYELTKTELVKILQTKENKLDWGMIWSTV